MLSRWSSGPFVLVDAIDRIVRVIVVLVRSWCSKHGIGKTRSDSGSTRVPGCKAASRTSSTGTSSASRTSSSNAATGSGSTEFVFPGSLLFFILKALKVALSLSELSPERSDLGLQRGGWRASLGSAFGGNVGVAGRRVDRRVGEVTVAGRVMIVRSATMLD